MDSGKHQRLQRESDCIKRLCKILQNHGQHTYVKADVRPASSSTLRNKWDKLTEGIGLKLQPQIDILVESEKFQEPRGTILWGIEVKYFERLNKRFNWSFYAGLDEAIATLNYGLDHSALWQIFSPSIAKKDLVQYGGCYWKYIKKLNLPIEFSLLIDRKTDFDVFTADGNSSFKLSDNLVAFNRKNPIKNEPLQRQLRKMIYERYISRK